METMSTPAIPALGKKKPDDQGFKVILHCVSSLRPAEAT